MRYFIIDDMELESLTYMNDKAALFFSLASFMAASFVSILLGYSFSGTPNDVAWAMTRVGMPATGLGFLLMLILGLKERRDRSAIIDRIKRDSRPQNGSGQA